jgi:hypothetical protein
MGFFITAKLKRTVLTSTHAHNDIAMTYLNYYLFLDYAISGQHIGREGECSFLFESKRERSGTFNSPRHPDNYPPNIECVYIFQPESRNEKLLISFDMFQLSSGDHIAEPIIDPHSRKYVMSKK